MKHLFKTILISAFAAAAAGRTALTHWNPET